MKNENKFNFVIIFLFILISNINAINNSEIKMIIKGKGTQRILYNIYVSDWICSDCQNDYSEFYSIPSEIYVNNQLQNYTDFFVYFSSLLFSPLLSCILFRSYYYFL